MGKILAGAFMPHPPLIIPVVGKDNCNDVEKTIAAVKKAAARLAALDPDTVVIMTPHGLSFRDAASMAVVPELTGNMKDFAAPGCTLRFDVDIELSERYLAKAAGRGLTIVRLDGALEDKAGYQAQLDSGAFVPLYYLAEAGFNGKIVHICPGLLTWESAAVLGEALIEAAAEGESRVAVIGSGDLSHYLKEAPPYGRRPEGGEFDRIVIEALADNDREKLLSLDRRFVECAGECGFRSLLFVMTALAGFPVKLLSYEGPFGVGYAVALWQEASLPVRLARWTIAEWLKKGSAPGRLPEWSQELLKHKAGVFVSLHKKGQLRGCMGTFLPCRESLAQEIEQNALLAAREDPRFPPLTQEELADLEISVDILSEPEKIPSLDYLDVKKYGVIVSRGTRRGLLLPDLDGVDSEDEQVSIAMRKAGIRPDESIDLYRFTVRRHES